MNGQRDPDRLIFVFMLRRLTALGLAFVHAVLLTGAISLHTHGPETMGVDLASLPAQYHHHHFGYAPGGKDPTPAHDDCIGCRIERAMGLPLAAVSSFIEGRIGTAPAEPAVARPGAARLDDLLPRAPPLV